MALKDRIIEIAYELKDKFSSRVRQVTSSIRSVEAASDKSTAKIERNNTRVAASFGGVRSAVLSVKAGFASVLALFAGGAAGGVLSVNREMEKLRITLDQITGSAEAGEQAFEWIQDFAKDTPFALDQVAQGFVKLKAFGLDPINGSYQAIADQAAALGGSQETLNGIILAVGQAWAKQKLQGEEILQLVERGVPVWDLLAQATGKNAQELQKLSEKGELGRSTIAALIAEMGKGANGAALAQVQTLDGSINNLGDAWTRFLDNLVGDKSSGILAASIREIGGFFDGLTDTVKRNSKTIDAVLGGLVGAFKIKFAAIKILFNGLQIAIKSSFYFIDKTLSLFSLALSKVTFGEVSKEFERSAKDINATADDLRDGIGEDVADIVDGLETMATAFDTDMEKSAKATEKAQKKIKSASEKVVQALDTQIEAAKKNKEAHEENAQALEKSLADSQNALKKAVNDAKSVKAEFQQLVDEIRSGGGKPKEDLTILDFDADLRNAKKALAEGDFDGAIDGARKAAETLRAMQESGKESALVLGGPGGLADQLAKLANEASDKKVEAGEQAVKSVEEQLEAMQVAAKGAEQAIKDLENRKIEINTNTEQSVQNLKDTQSAMQRQADGQPIVQPVVTSSDDPQAQLDALFERERKINAGEVDVDTAPAEQKIEVLKNQGTELIDAMHRNLQQAAADAVPKQVVDIDTAPAMRKIQQLRAEAGKPIQIHVNAAGNSFTDRPRDGFEALAMESLRNGHRK